MQNTGICIYILNSLIGTLVLSSEVQIKINCTGADRTELYIGLDFPAEESHWEGYRKICDYLPNIIGFKNVVIDLLTGVVYAFSTAIGFGLALTLFAGLREQMSLVNIPKGMKGTPIALITAGLLAMAFMGFSGVVKI